MRPILSNGLPVKRSHRVEKKFMQEDAINANLQSQWVRCVVKSTRATELIGACSGLYQCGHEMPKNVIYN